MQANHRMMQVFAEQNMVMQQEAEKNATQNSL
jgi:hypothetical protein